jgi:hypothetical protein
MRVADTGEAPTLKTATGYRLQAAGLKSIELTVILGQTVLRELVVARQRSSPVAGRL